MAMHALSAGELLEVWEGGLTQVPAVRALSLLAAACPEASLDDLAALSIGQRDARLLEMRAGLFGPELAAVVICPGCHERLELTFSTAEMTSRSRPEAGTEISLSIAGFDITLRPPNSQDVIGLAGEAGQAEAPSLLLQQCLLSVEREGAPVDSAQLPSEVVEAVTQRVVEADPLADIQMAIICPFCARGWHAAFDVVSFFWSEIEAWAWRILSDVHTLASAYGWCERDILALGPTRRQFYLDMVGA